ncbi:MAG: hypothetical protein EOL86_08855 [Deltaproteobacteria bacterium]|nr:hypothetical protein [Deltaproteobacteria bacterium]
MSAAEVLHQLEAAGVRVVMPEPGRLRLIGTDDARAKVKALVLEHRQEIAEHLAASASFLDPVEAGYLDAYKAMANRSECRGYPQACPRCRLLMADLETCLLGPEAEHVATASQEPAGAPEVQSRANGRKNSQSPAAGRTERKTEGLK